MRTKTSNVGFNELSAFILWHSLIDKRAYKAVKQATGKSITELVSAVEHLPRPLMAPITERKRNLYYLYFLEYLIIKTIRVKAYRFRQTKTKRKNSLNVNINRT